MEIIMRGDFVGGCATSMSGPSNTHGVRCDDPSPQESGELQQSSEPKPMSGQQDFYMLLGGGMTLLAGVLAIINGLRGLFTDGYLALGPDSSFTRDTYCGILVLVFGVIAVAGGISGIKRKSFALALAGSVMGMMGGGVYGFFLGLGALIIFGFSNQDLTS